MARRPRALIATISLMVCAGAANAQSAQNPPGFYVGAGLGDATPQGAFHDPYSPFLDSSSGHELGWNALVGIRPFRWVGAELQYLDFGHSHVGSSILEYGPAGTDIFYGGDGHTDAAAAFAVAYLPLPRRISWLDVFGKVGVAQTWTHFSYSLNYPDVYPCVPNSNPLIAPVCTQLGRASGNVNTHETDLAYGGGLQVHFGAFAVRAEYQSLDSKFGNPALLSVGVTWTL